MPTNYADELIKLAAPHAPTELPSAQDWKVAESDVGLEFPQDFKALVSALGTGDFGIGLGLRNPRASSDYILLSKEALLHYREVVAESEHESGITLYPKPRGLVSVAKIDRQGLLLRPREDNRSLEGLVWWDLDYDRATNLNMPISQFIYDLYLGRIQEPWALQLRNYIWRDGKAPFFTCWRGASPGQSSGERGSIRQHP